MLVKLLHSINAPALTSVTPSGISTLVKPVQPLKATSSIIATLAGIFVFLHPARRRFLFVAMIALQFPLLS